MNRLRLMCGFVIAGILSVPLLGQSPQGLASLVSDGSADRAVESDRSLVQIQASTDDTNATISTGWKISSFTPNDRSTVLYTTVNLSASAPLSKGGAATSIVASNGFPDSFVFSSKFSKFILHGRRTPDFDNPIVAARLAGLCDTMRDGARARGLSEDDVKALPCDSERFAKYAPKLIEAFNGLLFDKNQSSFIFGGSTTVGHRKFDYVTADLKDGSSNKTPWGASIFAAILPHGMNTLVTAGFDYRNKQKDADTKTICPQTPAGTQVECKTGPFGQPVDANEETASVEMRRFIGSHAVSLKVAYDFKGKKTSLDLPIYLIPSASSGMAGGIRLGWVESEGVQLGVFVSSSFSLFPK